MKKIFIYNILLLIVAFSISSCCCPGFSSTPTPTPTPKTIVKLGTYHGDNFIYVSTSLKYLEEFREEGKGFVIPLNEEYLNDFVISGKGLKVKKGVQVKVLETGEGLSAICKIEILEGPYVGRIGYVISDCLDYR